MVSHDVYNDIRHNVCAGLYLHPEVDRPSKFSSTLRQVHCIIAMTGQLAVKPLPGHTWLLDPFLDFDIQSQGIFNQNTLPLLSILGSTLQESEHSSYRRISKEPSFFFN
jgi:hypothetical protein